MIGIRIGVKVFEYFIQIWFVQLKNKNIVFLYISFQMYLIKNNKKILVDYFVEVQSCVYDINQNIYREIDFLGFDNIIDVLRIF